MARIAAEYVYTLDRQDPIRCGYVEYAPDGTITTVGECTDRGAEEVFLDGALVPGFVNAHCHLELSYMRGIFRKGTGMAGFIDQINALRDVKPKEERVSAVRFWMNKMWERGVSAMADISNGADSFDIKRESPMYTRTFLEVFGTEREQCDEVMRDVKELTRYAELCELDAAPTPHACYTMSPELLTEASAAALRSGFLSYHSQETPQEEEMIRYGRGLMWENRRASGMSVPPVTGGSSLKYFIDRLEKAHPAPFDEHILLVHEVCMDEGDIAAVKKVMRHPFVALCPLSNLFIHNALPPVGLLRSSGLTLTIGTDSLSSNDDLDMVAEMRCLQDNFAGLELGELLSWACLNGARFLMKDSSLGSIEVGKKPGLVFIGNLGPQGRLTKGSYSKRIV